MNAVFENRFYRLSVSEDRKSFIYSLSEAENETSLALPEFEIDGKPLRAEFVGFPESAGVKKLRNGVAEYRVVGALKGVEARLTAVFRVSRESPVMRFRYELSSDVPLTLTKSGGMEHLTYFAFTGGKTSQYREIQFSNFNETVHSYCLCENEVGERYFEDGGSVMGPMLLETNGSFARLTAYEHGSQVPDRFLEFRLSPDRAVRLCAVKGNTWDGQTVAPGHPFETIWFEFAVCAGGEAEMARHYRRFVLHDMSLNTASRKPYIFYNTWAFQERDRWWNQGSYFDGMNLDHILREIEAAHAMGIEVFVLDNGWFEQTGDWKVNLKRFPDGFKTIKQTLDRYGMKLGLWFDPQGAAASSRVSKENRDCVMKTANGTLCSSETDSRFCLVSRYAKTFAQTLIHLNKEYGVTYFKWDAIFQYGCYGAGHGHGEERNSAEERGDCYAFSLGPSLCKIADAVCEACPDAIVDFDITESGRGVGLGFLSSGKYFQINNGPYYHSFDIPKPRTEWSNVFVYPGMARARICRAPLTLDKWLPSVLFLTHYLPDDPEESQIVNVASLILGQNGLWGDLLSVSPEGVRRIHDRLTLYKKVRDDITLSDPVTVGTAGDSIEIHEKINPENGRGAVVVFAQQAGKIRYITEHKPNASIWKDEGVAIRFDARERAVIDCSFSKAGAKILFFGV